MIDLSPYFKHAQLAVRQGGETSLCDPELNTEHHYLSCKEADLLHRIATICSGDWLDIGSQTGWTAAHIAAAGSRVVALDPGYSDVSLKARAERNLLTAKLHNNVLLLAKSGVDFLQSMPKARFPGICIGCDPETGNPLIPAPMAAAALQHDGCIFMRDYACLSTQEAVTWFRSFGFRARTWDTLHGVAVLWRGEFEIPT
jgi:hypothetical protein